MRIHDEPQVREVARAALEHFGFEVVDASNGEEALRIFGAGPDNFVVVLLDVTKHAPGGKILKPGVSVAKNYLSEAHVQELNRIVSAYLDLAEIPAQRATTLCVLHNSIYAGA